MRMPNSENNNNKISSTIWISLILGWVLIFLKVTHRFELPWALVLLPWYWWIVVLLALALFVRLIK